MLLALKMLLGISFFLCIESSDPKFELAEVKGVLSGLEPEAVVEVEK